MKFLADENIDKPIVFALRERGYDVLYIPEISPSDSDEKILNLCNKENAILLTSDKDFGELIFRRQLISRGIVLLRLAGLSEENKISTLVSFLEKYQTKLLNHFTVVTNRNARSRKLLS